MINLFQSVAQNPSYFKQLKCRDLLFTLYDCPQENVLQDLFSQHNYIAYVISGKRIFHLPAGKNLMTKGKCVFAKKGAWIAEKEPAQGWCVLVFFIPDDYIKNFVKSYRAGLPQSINHALDDRQIFDLDVNSITHGFFQSMIPYFDQQANVSEELLELKFKELLLNLLTNRANEMLLSWFFAMADSSKQPLQQVMDVNYIYNLSIEDYAKIANRSLASFKREFQEIYHTSPGRWLLQKRLSHSGLLLTTTTKNINEVAFESGFENATHFSRSFRNKFHTSPSEFRSQHSSVMS